MGGLTEQGGAHQIQDRLHLPHVLDPGCAICLVPDILVAFSRHDKTTAGSNLVWEKGVTLLMVPETTQPTIEGRHGSRSWGQSNITVRNLSDLRGTGSGAKLHTSKPGSQHALLPASL